MATKDRKVWFITRPERDPAFHKEALEALSDTTKNFSLKWKGNRDIHKRYEEILNNLGLKRNAVSKDGSGGRTWAALLRTFCYCYLNCDGFLVPTKVGQEILHGHNVRENITKQILTLQIPNAYFLESGFKPKYESDFSIRPARFLIKLCCSDLLNYYITKEELTFLVMTSHKDSQLNDVINNILNFRKSNESSKELIRQHIVNIYEHRQRSDNSARTFEDANSDVAHTFMLAAEYTQLVDYIRGEKILKIQYSNVDTVKNIIKDYDKRYPFNNKYLFSLERMAETNGLDINSYKASNYKNIKPAANQKKKILKAKNILSKYPKTSFDEKIKILSNEFIYKDAEMLAEYFSTKNNIENLTNEFVSTYLDEKDDLLFEYETGKILKLIGFEIIMHPTIKSEKTEIDILLKYQNNLCGIIDAKNYKTTFNLSASLASHMAAEYIYNYKNYEGCSLQFFGYVASNDIKGTKNLNKITKMAERTLNKKIYGFMINARSLLSFLDCCIENNLDKDTKIKLFLKLINNSSYTNFHSVINQLK
ncbi:AlwI family type II restriction endonuclease [Clostridium tyrobutyricum]|uniref:AlwI family type II restriction endonuclease n=1 Tax=Clostridium tyrobutyricum TaxID=1519 RepID=UPI0018AB016E|nr:AlwI family type II restriction endonuclease [Clostridium tyrobutyricum]